MSDREKERDVVSESFWKRVKDVFEVLTVLLPLCLLPEASDAKRVLFCHLAPGPAHSPFIQPIPQLFNE